MESNRNTVSASEEFRISHNPIVPIALGAILFCIGTKFLMDFGYNDGTDLAIISAYAGTVLAGVISYAQIRAVQREYKEYQVRVAKQEEARRIRPLIS